MPPLLAPSATLPLAQQREARRWLQLGVASLALAGLFALLLVLSRMPGISDFFPWTDFFHTALVIHVDQSVLIWFLAMAGLVWAQTPTRLPAPLQHLTPAAWWLALLGTLTIALSAFGNGGAPLMNNYVPVLQRPLFFVGLGLFGAGISVRLLLTLAGSPWRQILRRPTPWTVVSLSSALATATAIAALLWSWYRLPPGLQGQGYYELLFWGPGHILQFSYSQLLLLAWLSLAGTCGVPLIGGKRWLGYCLWLGVAPILVVPVIYLNHEIVSAESRIAFTRLMQFGGGLAAIPIGLALLHGLLKAPGASLAQRPLHACLVMSMVLFASGGILALLISGINTIIPAHYHGSIVGITLALMGLGYALLPRLGYPPAEGCLARIQPLCYGWGQLLHITGLALSGAMNIQRKTAGAAQGLDSLAAKAAMTVMGIGGLLAVIGGILFVWIMLRAFTRKAAYASPKPDGR